LPLTTLTGGGGKTALMVPTNNNITLKFLKKQAQITLHQKLLLSIINE
jgi:hypothetical protein